MPISRSLPISMCLMVFLGALMLGVSQHNTMVPSLAAAVCLTSLYFTDIKGWLVLSTNWANAAGLIVMVFALWDFPFATRDVQLLSLANLLVYLQCILLYRAKVPRIYWMLCLLSLLQVAVASVLVLDAVFGLLLIAYVFVSLTSLVLFLLYREQHRYLAMSATRPNADAHPATGRWPYVAQPCRFHARPRSSPERMRGLIRYVAVLGTATLLFAPFVFALIPRAGKGQSKWFPGGGAAATMVGFAEEVALGEIGTISENTEEVMRVSFVDHRTDRPYPLLDTPLFRGTTLTEYTRGQWSPFSSSLRPLGTSHMLGNGDIVEQQITLEPLGNTDVVFAVFPVASPTDGGLSFDDVNERLARPHPLQSKSISFRLLTNGIQNGHLVPYRPLQRSFVDAVHRRAMLHPFARDYRGEFYDDAEAEKLRDSLLNLRRLADEAVAGVPSGDDVGRARALEAFLRDSGRYNYSLSPPVRDPGLDPIEDFLNNNPSGHCEYFASALTLMLRSQGIPARMVVGFKGGDYNEVGGFYQVRQLHAHTWVEALVLGSQLPDDLPFRRRRSAWLRLDPTPAAQAPEVSSWSSVQQYADYGRFLWAHYVLGMNAQKQHREVYAIAGGLFDAAAWRQWWQDVTAAFGGDWSSFRWFNWRAGVVALVAQVLLVLLYKLIVALRRRQRPQAAGGAARAVVEFYRRLEELLAACQIRRTPGQTQREFALAAGGQLADHAATHGVSAIPRRIADAFYQVRFGGRSLSEEQQRKVEQSLADLEQALQVRAAATL